MTPRALVSSVGTGVLVTILLHTLGAFPLGPQSWADVRADVAQVCHLRVLPPNFDTHHLRR